MIPRLIAVVRDRDEAGAVTATVAVLPASIFLFFLVVQVSLWYYGQTVTTAAAQHGLDAARVLDGEPEDGETVVEQFFADVGGVDSYSPPQVDVDAEEVTVTVEAEPIPVLPFFRAPTIAVSVSGPRERLVE